MIQTLSDALAERGYDTLTAVQTAVTDPELEGADLLVSAQTGSGKTVGFGLAVAPTLLAGADTFGPAGAPLALIVAPTRELALQVMRELQWLYGKTGARVVSCVGGMDARDERRALERGAHVVVGTPGRLVDHIRRGALDMASLRAVVLDEADEMLDLGFREDLEFMLGEAPEDRRTLLFSATVPPMIATLAKHYQRDAVRVQAQTPGGQHADIAYQALRVAQSDAETSIVNVLRFHDARNAIVFANTRAAVNRLTARLSNRGFSVVALSGELSQTERTHALQAMRDGRARVCVATDVAARGIDLPALELVIHAELPSNAEALLHRSGRTGRAGRKGISALIVPPKIAKKAERLLRFAKVQAEWTVAPQAEDILRGDEDRLLADPMWEAEATGDEAAFTARLIAEKSPEAIAAACLRLYRAGLSAPEDLSDPDARPARAPKEDRGPFGPAKWIALSVGRDDNAEARWLLPLLLRTGDMDKSAIGAIRVQRSETFVELDEAKAAGFLSALAGGTDLENGVSARLLDAPPDLSSGPRGPRPDRGPNRGPDRGPDRGAAKPRAPRRDDETRPPRPQRTAPPTDVAPDAAPGGAPAAEPVSREGAVTPYRKPRHDAGDGPRKGAPKGPRPDRPSRDDDRPRKAHGDRPRWDKPRGDKPGGGPRGGKPGEKPFDRKPGGKPFGGKPGGKPFGGKPAGGDRGRPAGKPAAARADASDTSKRFVPPGKAGGGKTGAGKTGGRPGGGAGKGPARKGGDAVPRRPKRP